MGTSRKSLVKKADAAFSRYIRARDGWTCFVCGKRGYDKDGVMQCGHLITRAKYSVRWDERNAVCQCSGCNMRHEYEPQLLTAAWIAEHGVEAYYELVRDANVPRKHTEGDLKEYAEDYERRYQMIIGGE